MPNTRDAIRSQLVDLAGSGTLAEVTEQLALFAANCDDWVEDSPLLTAARENPDPAVFRLLLEQGFSLEVESSTSYRVLHELARRGWADEIELAIDRGADIEARLVTGTTPLMVAAAKGRVDSVRALLRRGADVLATSQTAKTPLHCARAEVVPDLVAAGAALEAKCGSGLTPLQDAACNGDAGRCRALVACGAHLETLSNFGRTALLQAAQNRCHSAFSALLEMGADAKCGQDDTTALEACCTADPVLRASYDSYSSRQAMLAAARSFKIAPGLASRQTHRAVSEAVVAEVRIIKAISSGSLDQVKDAIGPDVDLTGAAGANYVLAAAGGFSQDVAGYFVDQGASVTNEIFAGTTALQKYAERGWADLVERAILAGVDINATTNVAPAALVLAAWRGHVDVVRLLISRGARLDTLDSKGASALHGAGAEVVDILCDAGLTVDLVNFAHLTPLMVAPNGAAAARLIDRGANVHAIDQAGNTPIAHAAERNHPDVVAALLEAGASLDHPRLVAVADLDQDVASVIQAWKARSAMRAAAGAAALNTIGGKHECQ